MLETLLQSRKTEKMNGNEVKRGFNFSKKNAGRKQRWREEEQETREDRRAGEREKWRDDAKRPKKFVKGLVLVLEKSNFSSTSKSKVTAKKWLTSTLTCGLYVF